MAFRSGTDWHRIFMRKRRLDREFRERFRFLDRLTFLKGLCLPKLAFEHIQPFLSRKVLCSLGKLANVREIEGSVRDCLVIQQDSAARFRWCATRQTGIFNRSFWSIFNFSRYRKLRLEVEMGVLIKHEKVA